MAVCFPVLLQIIPFKTYAKSHVRKETRDKNKTNRKKEWSPLPTLLNDGKLVKLSLKKQICNFPCFQSFLDGLWDSQTTKAIRLGASRLYLQVWLKGNWKFHDFSEKKIPGISYSSLECWCFDVNPSFKLACQKCVFVKIFRNNKNLMEITSKPFGRPLSQKSEPPSFYTDFHLDPMAKLSQNRKLPAPNINKSSLKKMLNMHFHKQTFI